jgi:hypothetical protein
MILKFLSGGVDLGRAALGVAGAGWLRWRAWLAGMVLVAGGFSSQAQWLTQTNVIKPGWTAVYFNVDASSQTLDSLVGFNPGCPIDQIWLWKTLPDTAQYISSPEVPLAGNSQWLTYFRPSSGSVSSLLALAPNSAYLVHSSATTNFTWKVQGQPVPPSYVWDNTGLNFIGFSTPYANPPSFESFLAPAPLLASGVQLFDYVGGPFSAQNPAQVFSVFSTPVTRGQAYWMSDTNINNTYFGPFMVNLPNPSGLNFGNSGGQITVHLLNVTSNALTISMHLLPSETPPYGQTNIVGLPPVLIEGALDATNLTYGFTTMAVTPSATATNSYSWTLPAGGQGGSDIAVVLGINRFALANTPPGSLFAGILQFTDSLGLSEIDVPVSVNSANNAGLWVGDAAVSQVGSYLKSYATNSDGSLVTSAVTNQVFTTNGLPFITTNVVLGNNSSTNETVTYYDVTNLVVNSYTTNQLSIVTNGFVVATNEVINTYAFTNLVITSTVTNFYFTNSVIVWLSANTTNLSGSAYATTNWVPGTNQIAAVGANNRVVVTNLAVNYVSITNQVVTNGPFLGPVTNLLFSFQTATNFWETTNLAYNLTVTNTLAITTATNIVSVTNYAVTNFVSTFFTTTNYVATNTALAIITNGPNEIVVNPVINNYAETFQLNLVYDTNYFVISNNFALLPGATNFLGSTTNQLLAATAATNSTTGTNFAVAYLGISTNAAYLITTNQLVSSYSNYVVTAINTNLGAVPVAFPLRLIIFDDGTNSSLLQRVYYGYQQGGTNLVVATTENALDPTQLGTARRISAVHMPWTAANQPIPFSGQLDLGGTLTATFYEDYGDQAANPFLHTFHPDHNNLDLTKSPPQELPVGSQSFDISRQITLTVAPNTSNFLSLTAGNTSLAGAYQETVTLTGLGGATRSFSSAGTFSLQRISPIATLTTQ